MNIKYAILGYLSWKSLTGYDLKKLFADSDILYWSGSSNQIYRALVQLHEDGLATQNIEHQASGPSRKIYAITDKGRAALREWAGATPELPQLRHPFLVQMAWAAVLDGDALDYLLAQYEEEVQVKLLMLEEQQQRGPDRPDRSPREAIIWDMIGGNLRGFYARELAWVRDLRAKLEDSEEGTA